MNNNTKNVVSLTLGIVLFCIAPLVLLYLIEQQQIHEVNFTETETAISLQSPSPTPIRTFIDATARTAQLVQTDDIVTLKNKATGKTVWVKAGHDVVHGYIVSDSMSWTGVGYSTSQWSYEKWDILITFSTVNWKSYITVTWKDDWEVVK